MFQNVSAKNYHENKKRLLQEKLMKDFKIFLKKKMKKKQQHGSERYKNLSGDEKYSMSREKNIIK